MKDLRCPSPSGPDRFDDETRTRLTGILGAKASLIDDLEAVVGSYEYWTPSDEGFRRADRELSAQMRPELEQLSATLEALCNDLSSLQPMTQLVLERQFGGSPLMAEWMRGLLALRDATMRVRKRCMNPVGAPRKVNRRELCDEIADVIEEAGVRLTFHPSGALGRILYEVFAYLGNPPAESTLRDMLKNLKRRMRPTKPTARQ